MKKVIMQILKALAYFAVYFIPLNVIMFIVQYVYGVMKGREFRAAGIGYEEGLAIINENLGTINEIGLLIASVLILLTFFIIEKVKKTSIVKETDIKKVSGRQIGFTIIGATGGMFFLNFIMSFLPIPQEMMNNMQNGLSNITTSSLILGIVTNTILVPVMEEVVFRGYLFSRLNKAMPSIVAAIISSAVFGICHGGALWALWAFTVGMIICIVRIKSGSIIPGMIFHIIMNGFSTIIGHTTFLENIEKPAFVALTVVGGIMLLVYIGGILLDKTSARDNANATV